MNIGVIGVSHKQAAVEIRDAVAFTQSKKIEAMNILQDMGIEEIVIVSTCNRSEIYFSSLAIEGVMGWVRKFFVDYFDVQHLEQYFFEKVNEEAIEYLFRVASGLDSVIVGEDQILGQVKEAHELAIEIGASKKFLNRIFREAITFSKKVKNEFRISENPLSIASVAVKFLASKIEDLESCKVFIIGAGEMGRLTMKYLQDYGVGKIFICNRTQCKLEDITDDYKGVMIVPYEKRYEFLSQMDVVLSATASPHIIIDAERFPKLTKAMTLIDMALPIDIDRRIGEVEGVRLYDIDDLQVITDQNRRLRDQIAKQIEGLISEQVKELNLWLQKTKVDPIIESLHEVINESKENTMHLIKKKIELNQRELVYIEKLVDSALKRVIREPIRQLKLLENEEEIETYKKVIHRLFDF